MIYGYGGKILRIDLTNEQVTKEYLDEAILRKWVGGTGLGAKYLYDEVPAGVEWDEAGNRLILASGPLGGTSIGGSGTVAVVTKGALTNGATQVRLMVSSGLTLDLPALMVLSCKVKLKNGYIFISMTAKLKLEMLRPLPAKIIGKQMT